MRQDTYINSSKDWKFQALPNPYPNYWHLTLGLGLWIPHGHCVAWEVMLGDTHRESFPGSGFGGELIINNKPLCMGIENKLRQCIRLRLCVERLQSTICHLSACSDCSICLCLEFQEL